MADPNRAPGDDSVDGATDGADHPAEGPPPTPFDHPLFLPVLLVAGMVWFGYDGWINQDPEMLEHQSFNRWGFGALAVLAAWFGYKGWNEWMAERGTSRESEGSGTGRPPPLS
jgi:hypothetical protein